MALSQAVALLLVAAALASYVNCRFLRLPSTIGMTAMALAGSIVLIAVDAATPLDVGRAVGFVSRLDFRQLPAIFVGVRFSLGPHLLRLFLA